jgi:hypothetical protein
VAPALGAAPPPKWPKPAQPLGRPAPLGLVPLNEGNPLGLAVGRVPPPPPKPLGKPLGLAHAVEPVLAPPLLDELLEQPATTPTAVRPASEMAAALSVNALRIERPPAFPKIAGVVTFGYPGASR